jgi:hypothetical protein
MRALLLASGMALALVTCGCAATGGTTHGRELRIPIRVEPVFEEVPSSQLPADTPMRVLEGTTDLKAQLKVRFPALAVEGTNLTLIEEGFIRHDGKLYRRVWMEYYDLHTTTIHGACSQFIALWFEPSGKLAETYVSEWVCPI